MIIHNMKNVKSSQEIMKKKKRDQRDICKLTQNISHAQWDLIEEDLKEIGKLELSPKFEGKQMIMVIQPL